MAISLDTRDRHETLMLLLQPPRILYASTGHYPHPLGNWCSPPLPGSRDTGIISLGKHTACLRLLQHHASLCRYRLTLPSNYNYGTPPSPWPEWARAPKSATALTPSCLVGNRRLRATYMQRRGENQSWTPVAVQTKKRKGNFYMQPQEQQIKCPQSTWCTLHLWNTWIDNKSTQNWGGGLWEQL